MIPENDTPITRRVDASDGPRKVILRAPDGAIVRHWPQ